MLIVLNSKIMKNITIQEIQEVIRTIEEINNQSVSFVLHEDGNSFK